jgi:hypothetical protein
LVLPYKFLYIFIFQLINYHQYISWMHQMELHQFSPILTLIPSILENLKEYEKLYEENRLIGSSVTIIYTR